MDKFKSFIIGGIVAIIVLMIVLSGNGIQLGPDNSSMTIGCGLDRGSFAVDAFSPSLQEPSTSSTTQDPVPGNPPPYNNCLPDALAKINADMFSEDEGQLRYEITTCMQGKGYDPVKKGVPPSGVKDALACKEAAMKARGWNEKFGGGGTGKPGPGGPSIPVDSPFKNNCPPVGSKIVALFAGHPGKSGHAATCTVVTCNPANGHAVLDCTESSASSGGAWGWVADVGPSGNVITNPVTSLNGGSCIGFTTVSASK